MDSGAATLTVGGSLRGVVLPADESGVEDHAGNRREPALLRGRQQAVVSDFNETIRDLPEVLFRRHPAPRVEERKVERTRVAAQRLLPPQVEVALDVRDHEIAHGREDRLAESQTRIVRSGNRAPESVAPVKGDDVVVVVNRLEVDEERRLALDAQRPRREERSVHALNFPLPQHASGRAASLAAHVVVELVEELLNAPWG